MATPQAASDLHLPAGAWTSLEAALDVAGGSLNPVCCPAACLLQPKPTCSSTCPPQAAVVSISWQ